MHLYYFLWIGVFSKHQENNQQVANNGLWILQISCVFAHKRTDQSAQTGLRSSTPSNWTRPAVRWSAIISTGQVLRWSLEKRETTDGLPESASASRRLSGFQDRPWSSWSESMWEGKFIILVILHGVIMENRYRIMYCRQAIVGYLSTNNLSLHWSL